MKTKTIEIQILAEDIRTSNYVNPEDCAMTRALRRAGIKACEVGGSIQPDNGVNCFGRRITTPDGLKEPVKQMYAFIEPGWGKIEKVEPEDFTFSLEVPEYMLS